jgi:MFS family permease
VAPEAPALAPFQNRAFRWLWIGILISWTGTWMQTVGAQWLVVDAPNAATLVSLVQAATTLPVMMLALPGGVLADSFDRRWLLFAIQVYFFGVGLLLAVLTAAGQMPPALLIAFTFLLGAGAAVQLPTWAATVPELVPRTQLGRPLGSIWLASTCRVRLARPWLVLSSPIWAACRWCLP